MANRSDQAQRDWFVDKVKEILNKKKFPFDDVGWDKQSSPALPTLVIKSGKEKYPLGIRYFDLMGKSDRELEETINAFIDHLIADL